MPFRSIQDDGVLTSSDLDFLQSVYEIAVADIPVIDDAIMHGVVAALITYYRAGERDKFKLAALASCNLRRATG